ncbi:MAG: hypothetical protein DMF68_12945 [Acidobacteria bacterium]|nr:MAG: hypothetical protein DMF68_12945 [Acidobacteriota bacterium]
MQATNDELTARTNELQELGREITNERKLLTEMVENSPFLIMLLKGSSLVVSAYNAGYALLFNNRHVIGRPFEEIFSGVEMPNFIRLVREAYEQDSLCRTPRMHTHVANEQGESTDSHFIHTIVPVHDVTGKVDGVVIYTENVREA